MSEYDVGLVAHIDARRWRWWRRLLDHRWLIVAVVAAAAAAVAIRVYWMALLPKQVVGDGAGGQLHAHCVRIDDATVVALVAVHACVRCFKSLICLSCCCFRLLTVVVVVVVAVVVNGV